MTFNPKSGKNIVADSGKAPSLEALLKVHEVAAILAISPRKLWEITNRGEIRCVRIGRLVRYKYQDLQAFIEQHHSS